MSSNRPDAGGPRDDTPERYRTEWTRAPSVSMAVVEAVATVRGADPIDLTPLNDTIDPDALDALFESSRTRPGTGVQEISFRYGDREVTVRGTGELVVGPAGPSVSV